jgi:RND family efflux transporter MFP subunit
MKTGSVALLLIVCVALGAGGGYWWGHRGAGTKEADAAPDAAAEPGKSDAAKPVASVQVAPIRRAVISQQITAYGTVVAPPGEVRVISVPFECRVTKLFVAAGQAVSPEEALIEVEGSAAAALAMEEARNAAAAADRDLELVRKHYDQKLATNTDLFAAETAQRSAQGRLHSLEQAGAGGPRQLKADAAGIVSKVDVQIGQLVAIDLPLVEVAAQNRIEVKLGVEPEEVGFLKAGQTAKLHRVDDAAAAEIDGTIRVIAHRVDPASRLVDVNISLPADAKWMLEGSVAGQITAASAEGLVVPRQAVLPDESGQYSLFTISNGTAAKHAVRLGIENDREVQVVAEGLKEGDSVAVSGNFELDDGMKVGLREAAASEPAATEPAATEPAATEPAEPATTRPATTQLSPPAAAADAEGRK